MGDGLGLGLGLGSGLGLGLGLGLGVGVGVGVANQGQCCEAEGQRRVALEREEQRRLEPLSKARQSAEIVLALKQQALSKPARLALEALPSEQRAQGEAQTCVQ